MVVVLSWWALWIVVYLRAGALVLLLPSLLLHASCSLADVKEPPLWLCVPFGLAVVLVFFLLHWTSLSLLLGLDLHGVPTIAVSEARWVNDALWWRGSDAFAALPSDQLFSAFILSLFVITLPVVVALAALGYFAVFAPSFVKGLRIAAVQAGLQGLALALAVGVWMTVIATLQCCGFKPENPSRPTAARVVPADRS